MRDFFMLIAAVGVGLFIIFAFYRDNQINGLNRRIERAKKRIMVADNNLHTTERLLRNRALAPWTRAELEVKKQHQESHIAVLRELLVRLEVEKLEEDLEAQKGTEGLFKGR